MKYDDIQMERELVRAGGPADRDTAGSGVLPQTSPTGRRVCAGIVGLVLVASTAICAWAGQTVDEKASVSKDGRVDIENLGGSVRVIGWDKNEVTVEGVLADDAEDFVFEADDRRTKIEVIFPRRMRGNHDVDSDLEVHVPKGSRVRVSTVSATIDIKDVTGSVDLESVSGEITVVGPMESAEAQSVSGELRISGKVGEIDAGSVSGDVILDVPGGDVAVSTVSGDIETVGGVFESGDFSSVSGSIEFDGAPTESGSLEFDCHSGRVRIKLPSDLSAEVDVNTFSGDIDSAFGPKPRRTSDYAPGKELSFTMGDGDARISINTFSGSVRIVGK
ncbi:MAG: DUF4097 family beta strand repeat protein [Candidatus Eisenbacteria bacterium]|uniref:DUF4097 family beta strand repeat protein n=1 Tax=Eiseniibacteriota bacterium TaxID=2212470 RepID=A0A956NCV0_UNCEI|nr:DUF4097 family beta strand repeat protein [Candidatus Eisenbacteria bacterium]MCB9462179.1 DUF4097 family beta strand repeat protein [Candidatus Eisenbacteria bacterium]